MYSAPQASSSPGVLATGAIGAVAMTPASATTSDNVVTSRLAHIKSALSGPGQGRTLTQAQADKVAGTLDSQPPMGGGGGRGGMGGGGMGMTQSHDAAAKALGMTSDELYTGGTRRQEPGRRGEGPEGQRRLTRQSHGRRCRGRPRRRSEGRHHDTGSG